MAVVAAGAALVLALVGYLALGRAPQESVAANASPTTSPPATSASSAGPSRPAQTSQRPTAAPSPSPRPDLRSAMQSAFSGSWSGVVSQFDDGPRIQFPMTLDLRPQADGVAGRTTYELDTGQCVGEVRFVSGDASTVHLSERIASGPCVAAGSISLRQIDESSVSFEYRTAKRDGAVQVVRGVLTR